MVLSLNTSELLTKNPDNPREAPWDRTFSPNLHAVPEGTQYMHCCGASRPLACHRGRQATQQATTRYMNAPSAVQVFSFQGIHRIPAQETSTRPICERSRTTLKYRLGRQPTLLVLTPGSSKALKQRARACWEGRDHWGRRASLEMTHVWWAFPSPDLVCSCETAVLACETGVLYCGTGKLSCETWRLLAETAKSGTVPQHHHRQINRGSFPWQHTPAISVE